MSGAILIGVLLTAATCETIAIRKLSNPPQPDWHIATGAGFSANLMAGLSGAVLHPILLNGWDAIMPLDTKGIELWGLWFCAFNLANGIELLVIRKLWHIPLTPKLSWGIALSNSITAFFEIFNLWNKS